MQATMHGAKVGNSALQVAALSSVIVISRAFLSLSTPQHREKKKKKIVIILCTAEKEKKSWPTPTRTAGSLITRHPKQPSPQ